MSWLEPPKESKYGSNWFVPPIVKNKPDIYRYKKKPLSNDDTYSDDSDYYEDDFESDDEDVGEFKNKEKVFDESIKRTRYDILEKEKQKRKADKDRRNSKQWDIDANRPLTEIQKKRWELQQNKKGGNKKNNKNLVYMSGKNPFAKLRQLLSRRKRSRKRFSRRRMGSRRRSMRRRMGSRRRSMRRRMGSMRRRRRRRSRAKVAILRKLPDGDVLVDMPPYRRRKRSRRRRRRGRSGRRMGSMRRRFGRSRRRFGRSMRRRNKSKRKRRRKRRK